MTLKPDFNDFNRRAQECTSHRMVQTASERVLVNPRYDNGSEEPSNVKEYSTTFKCLGQCQQEITHTSTNKP